jgi:hypothetical protein
VSQFVTDFDKFLLIEVINRRANASDACVVSAILNARRRSCRALVRQHFALKRHLLRASLYRKQLAAWHRFTEITRDPSAF